MANLIEQIAYARGIASEYIDASGQQVIISDECKLQCLKALGYNVDDQEALAAQFGAEQDALFVSGTEPVFVTTENKAIEITLRLTMKLNITLFKKTALNVRVNSQLTKILVHIHVL